MFLQIAIADHPKKHEEHADGPKQEEQSQPNPLKEANHLPSTLRPLPLQHLHQDAILTQNRQPILPPTLKARPDRPPEQHVPPPKDLQRQAQQHRQQHPAMQALHALPQHRHLQDQNDQLQQLLRTARGRKQEEEQLILLDRHQLSGDQHHPCRRVQHHHRHL